MDEEKEDIKEKGVENMEVKKAVQVANVDSVETKEAKRVVVEMVEEVMEDN